MSVNESNKITVPFANSGLRNEIPETPTGSNLASMQEGFPAITMTDISSGGQPPDGKDFNGILNVITKILQYAQSGGLYKYDSAYATAVGGYPLGAIIRSATGSKIWVNQSANNATDPDNSGTNWVELTNATDVSSALSEIYAEVAGKQDTLTFDSTPTAGSNNPVTSNGIKGAIDALSVLPSQAGQSGKFLKTNGVSAEWDDIRALFIDIAHPIGSWYATDDPRDPSEIFEGTTWQRLTGKKGLIACDTDISAGTESGNSSITLTVEQLPAHTHTQDTCDTQGAHTHERNTLDITGSAENFAQQSAAQAISGSGAFTAYRAGSVSYGTGSAEDSSRRDGFNFKASNGWSGKLQTTGGHSHTVTLNDTGSGAEIDIMNPYYATYIWKRIS